MLDDDQIDAEVDQFRDFLDQLAPDDFALDTDPSGEIVDAEIVDTEIVDAEIVDDPPDAARAPEE